MTEIVIPLWSLITFGVGLLLGFGGFVFSVWRIVSGVRDKTAADALARAEENERDLLNLQARLPLEYTRREDWIRTQSIIEAKLDALAAKLDGGKRGY